MFTKNGDNYFPLYNPLTFFQKKKNIPPKNLSIIRDTRKKKKKY